MRVLAGIAALVLTFSPAAAQEPPAVSNENVAVGRVAIDWVRAHHFVQDPDVSEVMDLPEEKVTHEPPARRIDREAFAIVAPVDDPDVPGGRPAAVAYARAVANALDVPYDSAEAFLNCSDPEPGQRRRCSFRRGIESYFRFDELQFGDSAARVTITWSFILDRRTRTQRYVLRLRQTEGTWSVEEVLRRSFLN